MATVIDALVVTLGLDAKAFTKGQKDIDESLKKTRDSSLKAGKDIESAANKGAEAFSYMRTQVMALMAAFAGTASLTAFLAQITKMNANIGRMAEVLGKSPTELDAFGKAVEKIGGDGRAAMGSIKSLDDAFQELRTTGQSAMLPWLARLQAAGGVRFDITKSIGDQMDKLNAAAQRIKKTQGVGMARYMLEQLGLDPGSVRLLLKDTAEYERIRASTMRYAASPGQTAAAGRLSEAWNTVVMAVEKVGSVMLEKLEPLLTWLVEKTNEWVDALLKWLQSTKLFDELSAKVLKFIKYLQETPWDQIVKDAKKAWDDITKYLGEQWTKFSETIIAPIQDALKKAMIDGFQAALDAMLDRLPDWAKSLFGISPAAAATGGAAVGGALGARGGAMAGTGWGATTGGVAGLRAYGAPSKPGGWWTPERQEHAITRLMEKTGMTRMGAAGLVARWAAVEAPGGPESVNPKSGAFGIGQWLGSRKPGIAGVTDFDKQIDYAAKELLTSERRAFNVLRGAKTEEEGARGASLFERAEGFNPITGYDLFTRRTPVGKVYGGKEKPAAEAWRPPMTLGAPGAATISNDNRRVSNNTTSSQTTINGGINVNAPGQDGYGIGTQINQQLERNTYAMMANYGAN